MSVKERRDKERRDERVQCVLCILFPHMSISFRLKDLLQLLHVYLVHLTLFLLSLQNIVHSHCLLFHHCRSSLLFDGEKILKKEEVREIRKKEEVREIRKKNLERKSERVDDLCSKVLPKMMSRKLGGKNFTHIRVRF